jgi:uncharacterized protein (DUF1499 family)
VKQSISQPDKNPLQPAASGNSAPLIGLGLIALFAIIVFMHRVELLSFHTTMAFIALIVVVMLAMFSCCAIAIINRKPCSYKKNIRKTLLITGILPGIMLLYTLYFSLIIRSPVIHDISTDLIDPPQFDKCVALRGSNSNSLAIKPQVIEEQKNAYPHIKTLTTSLSEQRAFLLALQTAKDIGWTVHNIDKQQGIIEAWEKTFGWGFIDDVIIRVSATNGGSAIDLRSVSRLRKSDLGSNARRIERFYTAFNKAQAAY